MQVFFLVDIAYLLALPFVVVHTIFSRLRGHPRRKDFFGRLGYGESLPVNGKRVLLHAVSVGEVNSLRTLVPLLSSEGYDVVICVTTDTGIDRARELYRSSCTVTRFPFDFSFAMRRFIKRINPNIVALVELEVWPNFIGRCTTSSIPVVIVNGRLSQRSFKRYKLAKPLLRTTFSRISAIGMQNETYSQRVQSLGGKNVSVQGTMKWDNVVKDGDKIEGVNELAENLGISRDKPLIVGASTAPKEHALFRNALPEGAQLLCAPRQPEWFDAAEAVLSPCNRRTSNERHNTKFFLLDTIGELDKAYALADLVIIGRSFVPMYGSDPTQPIALGKPTFIGTNYSDFQEMVDLFEKENAIVVCKTNTLADTLTKFVKNDKLCSDAGSAGRAIIESQQGASRKYLELIMENTPSG